MPESASLPDAAGSWRRVGRMPEGGEERRIALRGLRYAVCCWGEPGGQPVLALHGWQDNAASFSVLAPLLGGCRIVAPDLAGHGRSEHRPLQGGYHIWDDLPDLLALADALEWRRFSVLGHSRGAIIGVLLGVAAADRVRRVAALDGLVPWPVEPPDAPRQLARYLASGARATARSRRYRRFEDALAARVRAGKIGEAAARRLAYRGLALDRRGYYWRGDPRLAHSSALKLSNAHNVAMLSALRCPLLFLRAEHGVSADARAPEQKLDALCEGVADFRAEQLPGEHHFHMESAAEALASRLREFFAEGAEGAGAQAC